ncbi:DNA polymerase III subunit tau [Thalassocella blandensis]|nr:DNA polymerase III subunit tau [Thalassocella blandensis]
MSYQVLARKWRPRIFREMVGQEHVLKALINALDHKRLHHAYLFTGTRGVGKTTIARILAKCLNCETGVSSEPCGKCSACIEISEGRFVDLIEVDAASRTKVEDTRELLDNVQYAPTRGRYKIYLIDEVHMLSNHSFNALLKTLEEPPEHVKFLLATTDPQKLPVTILSRCLQFNLKNMSPERIVGHLQFILEKEVIPFEEPALWQLARSADGSMRDALSLTDQAISFGGGKVVETDVAAMLGTIDHVLIQNIMQALISGNGQAILQGIAKFAEHAPDFNAALADLLTLLHRIAIAQALPEALDNSYGDRKQILEFATQLAPEDVQLFYQTALIGRRDLPLASDPRSGFEMTLLRMLAFKPQGVVNVPTKKLTAAEQSASANSSAGPAEGHASEKKPQASLTSAAEAVDASPPREAHASEPYPAAERDKSDSGDTDVPWADEPWSENPAAPPPEQPVEENRETNPAVHSQANGQVKSQAEKAFEPPRINIDALASDQPSERATNDIKAELKQQVKAIVGKEGLTAAPRHQPATPAGQNVSEASAAAVTSAQTSGEHASGAQKSRTQYDIAQRISLDALNSEKWIPVYAQLEIRGIMQSTVSNCVLIGVEGNQLQFLLDEDKASLFDPSHTQRLSDLLSDYFGQSIKADIQLSAIPEHMETPARYDERIKAERRVQAIETLKNNEVIQALEREFDGQLIEESVKF